MAHYTLLTDLEAVFRSLKSELGLRPIHHRKARRAEGHLFITVIAYQLVQVIRKTLATRADGEIKSAIWTTLRRVLGGRQRVTRGLREEVRNVVREGLRKHWRCWHRGEKIKLGFDPINRLKTVIDGEWR